MSTCIRTSFWPSLALTGASLQGTHELWQPVTEAYKHIIRAFLLHFNARLLQSTSVRTHTHQGQLA